MRNLLAILSVVFIFISCSSGNNQNGFVINGMAPDILNNKMVYLYDFDKDRNIDSTLVKNGKFQFTGEPSNVRLYGTCNFDKEYLVYFIPEAGKITVSLIDQNLLAGTPLNDELVKFNKEYLNLDEQSNLEFDNIEEMYAEDPEILDQKAQELIEAHTEKTSALNKKYFDANKNNTIAKFIYLVWFNILPIDDKEDLITQMGEDLKKTEFIQEQIESLDNYKKTREGKLFLDFTLEKGNSDGSPASLSDYVGKGKFVLVNFWASWFDPSLDDFEILKEMNKKYKGDKFEILGVAVGDERDSVKNIVAQSEIPWPIIVDTEEIPLNKYLIEILPESILFGPDGTIIARNLEGELIREKVEEFLN